jgi:hypothetical protein
MLSVINHILQQVEYIKVKLYQSQVVHHVDD